MATPILFHVGTNPTQSNTPLAEKRGIPSRMSGRKRGKHRNGMSRPALPAVHNLKDIVRESREQWAQNTRVPSRTGQSANQRAKDDMAYVTRCELNRELQNMRVLMSEQVREQASLRAEHVILREKLRRMQEYIMPDANTVETGGLSVHSFSVGPAPAPPSQVLDQAKVRANPHLHTQQ